MRIRHVNMHIHTRCSDGVLKPKAVIEIALQNGLDVISITDHDTVEAYRHLPSSHVPLRVLPGIEFSSTWQDADIHVLGYGIDIHNKDLLELLDWMKEGRFRRAEKMLDKLSLLGIKIPVEHVLSFAGEMKLIVRPHIAEALVDLKHCRTKQEAFDKYIGNEAPAYVPKPMLTTSDVIRIIHDAGGVAVLAHPGKLRSLSLLQDFIDAGLDGLEVWHPDNYDALKLELEEICIKNGLIQTGGSDYHGDLDFNNSFSSVPVSELILRDIQSIWDRYKCMVRTS